jgi:hypothetical protein
MMDWDMKRMIGCNNARGDNAIWDEAETWLRGKDLSRTMWSAFTYLIPNAIFRCR